MQLKINYQASDQHNPFVVEALADINPLVYTVQRHFIIFVGPNRLRLETTRGNLIYQLAPKLFEALHQHRAGNANVFRNEDPQAFKFILQWLDSTLALDDDASICVPAKTMLKAFVFAERYGFETFFDSHVYGFVDATYDRLCEGQKMADADMISDLYRDTRAGSPIRHLLVDSIVWKVGHHDPADGPRELYQKALRRADGTMVGEIRQFYEDIQASFARRYLAANLADSVHPFQGSEQAVIARYSYSIGESSTDINTPSQGWEGGNDGSGARSGSGQFNLVIR